MKLSASMYHRLYNKIRVVGFRNEAGECLVQKVFKAGSLVNLLSFEFSDRNFPCGGFSRADVAEMNTLLEKEGVEITTKQGGLLEKFLEEKNAVVVVDHVQGVDVVVVDPMVNTKQPTQNVLAFLRREMNLPAHEAVEAVEVETSIFEEFEFLAQGNVFALSCLKSLQLGCENSDEICRNFLKEIYPTKPVGKSFQRDNFWARITPWAKLVLLSKSHEYQATKAAFLRLKRLHRKGVHPIAIFVPTPNAMPQPSTWADGHSGHVPSDGK